MGAVYRTSCYADPATAAAAMCARDFPALTSTGLTVCNASTATSLTIDSVVVPVAFAPCDPLEPYTDLGQLWAWGLAALVVLWCIKRFIVRQVAPH